MNNYNLSFERLIEQEFLQDKENFIEIGVALFKKGNINVILQNFDQGMNLEDIKKETIYIREKLHEKELNVWNTYYILCIDEDVNNDIVLFVERDPMGLRKYVIRDNSDLNRILFLDNIPINKIENPIKIKDSIAEEDTFIKSLYDDIEEFGGTEKIISSDSIKKILDDYC